LEKQPGFKDFFLLTNHPSGNGLAGSLWETDVLVETTDLL